MANYSLKRRKNFSVFDKLECGVKSNNRSAKAKAILHPYYPLRGRCYWIKLELDTLKTSLQWQ